MKTDALRTLLQIGWMTPATGTKWYEIDYRIAEACGKQWFELTPTNLHTCYKKLEKLGLAELHRDHIEIKKECDELLKEMEDETN